MARQSLTIATSDQMVDSGRANFILARVDIMTRQPEQAFNEFEKAAASAKETRILAWSHIYLGRMMDLSCRRADAVDQYKQALAVRDGEQDTRIAAERGLRKAYAPVQGHSCDADESAGDGAAAAAGAQAQPAGKPADSPFAKGKPGTTMLPVPVPDPPAAAAPQR